MKLKFNKYYKYIILVVIIFIVLYVLSHYIYNTTEYFSEKTEVNIILVCINKFQEYILSNIKQLIRLGHKNIYVITNSQFFNLFKDYSNQITLINSEDLKPSHQGVNAESTDFWHLTSSRFMYIYELMKRDNIQNVFHLENDVLIYYNCNTLLAKLDNNFYIPFDSLNRNIASIIYVPNHNIFKQILDNYDLKKNDMENFPIIKKKTNLIQQFPIINNDDNQTDPEYNFVSHNFDKFQIIFDAAAIGQYLGGVDPIHNANDTTGYINPDCIIKYDKYQFEWKQIDNIKKPFIKINNELYPIFNLHIHSKNLEKFI